MITANRLQSVEEYYFSKKLREVAQLKAQGKPVINLGIGSPDLPPPPQVIDALNSALVSRTAHQYQPYKGVDALRQGISDFYKTYYQVDVDPASEILPLMGSKEGILHISMAFLNHGDEVLLPNPGYPTYSSVTKLLEAETRYYELSAENAWMPNLEKLASEDLTKVKIMWVNYPHMPTGTNANPGFFEQLREFAETHKILVVNDNPYSFIQNTSQQSIHGTFEISDYVMELNSLSKSFNMAGWRVGMLTGSEKNINAVLKVKSNMDSGMFYPIQAGAIAALNLSEEWFEELNAVYSKRKKLVHQLAEKMNLKIPEGQSGMFVWAKVPESTTTEELVDTMLYDKDIFITPGFIFGSQGDGYVRFSLCADEETINTALKRLS